MVSATRSARVAALLLATGGVNTALAQTSTTASDKLDRTNWVAYADSWQPNGNEPMYAIDGNEGTFWHTEWSPVTPTLPHWLIVDMQNPYMVNGYEYLPRQDGSDHGNVGQHTIDLSLDNVTWTTAASGTWTDDATIKTTYFSPAPARFVRLSCLSAAGAGEVWSGADEVNVLTNPHSAVSRTNWAVTVDSQEQQAGESYNGTEAIDGAVTTYWHTDWTNTSPGFPHYFTIDQGTAVTIGGLSYLPRPDSTGPNGRIGQYQVQRSSTGKTNSWTTIANGTWADTDNEQYCEFAAVSSRYFRLVSLSEAGNRGPWTSAAEINLLDGTTQLNDFVITVDSAEMTDANCTGSNAGDNDITTFWHTPYSAANPPGYPHYITIDMQAQIPVHALQYIPRQDGSSNGNIGDHEIDVSTDGNTWTKVAKGVFIDDATTKLVNFEEITARYVRLTANTEAGDRGPWASAAEVTLFFDTSYTQPAANTFGLWGQMIDFPVVPVAAALIPSTGNVLAWSSYSGDDFNNSPGGETDTALYNIATGVVTQNEVTNVQHDMFCPGLSADFTGEVFVTGGNDADQVSVYAPSTNAWSIFPTMQIARGYQAQTTLSDGRIWTIGGSWSGGEGGKNAEVYSYANNAWTLLPGNPVAPMLTNDAQGVYRADNHGWLFSYSNGTVFQAGPSAAMNWYSTTGGYGGWAAAGNRATDPDSMNGNAVMIDAVAGKILTLGGAPSYQDSPSTNNVHLITLNGVNKTASVTTLASMTYRRAFANSVVLPDGSVFVVGGQEYANPFYDDNAILTPELWSPKTQTFTKMAPMVNPRVYHSIALLMPDATVISGGGGLCADCSFNHFDAQVFSPPYLFTSGGAAATRPVINTVSARTPIRSTSLRIRVLQFQDTGCCLRLTRRVCRVWPRSSR